MLKILDKLGESITQDSMTPERLEEHDNIFKPENEYEKIFWADCRMLAHKDFAKWKTSVNNGKLGGRPPKEKNVQELVAQTAENLSVDKAKDTIWIDDSFSVEKYPVFKIYVDEMPGSVIKSVEKWLKDKKNGQKVTLEFITQQFVNFAKRQNKPLFRKESK